MTTIEQKEANRLRLTNILLAALGEGLWNLLGDAAVGLTTQWGETILAVMEKEMGLEMTGENVEDWAAEIGRLYTDEFDCGKEFHVKATKDSVYVEAQGCMFQQACSALQAAGIPPYISPVRGVCAAALRRLGKKVRLGEIKREGDKCNTTFEYF